MPKLDDLASVVLVEREAATLVVPLSAEDESATLIALVVEEE